MSKIQVSCPACQRKLKVSPEVLGKKVRCPACKEVVRLTPAGEPPVPLDPTQSPNPPGARQTENSVSVEAADSPATVPADSRKPGNQPRSAADSAAPEYVAQDPVVPMAKLLQPSAPAAGESSIPPAGAQVAVSDLQIGEKPRVKFKRKRSNPWPTILLGVVALTVLGIAVTFIAIMQGGASQSAASDLPTIRYVNDAKVELGQTATIPIKVDFPDWMTMEEARKWNIEVGKTSPDGVSYDKESEAMTWTPGFRDAGNTGVIEAVIRNPENGKTNVARFQVQVAAIPLGSQQVHTKVEQWNDAGRDVTLGSARPVSGPVGTYHDLELDGTKFRVFVYNDPDSAIAAAETLRGAEPETVSESLTAPLEIQASQSVVLVGNAEQVRQNADLANWFGVEGNRLPGAPGENDGSEEMEEEEAEADE